MPTEMLSFLKNVNLKFKGRTNEILTLTSTMGLTFRQVLQATPAQLKHEANQMPGQPHACLQQCTAAWSKKLMMPHKQSMFKSALHRLS